MSQWYLISHALLHFCFNMSVTKEAAVALSVLIGVIICGCPTAFNILYISMTFCPLTNSPAVSASAAEVTTRRSSLYSMLTGPLSLGFGGFVMLLFKQ